MPVARPVNRRVVGSSPTRGAPDLTKPTERRGRLSPCALLVQRGQRNSAAIRQRDAGLPSPPLELGPRPAIVNGIAQAFLLTGCVITIIAA
jgi:hypothetical protein